VLHLKGYYYYGMLRVFRTEAKNGQGRYWATSELGMSQNKRDELEF
jgi:hypothetical protein